jgi:hypothetical protein
MESKVSAKRVTVGTKVVYVNPADRSKQYLGIVTALPVNGEMWIDFGEEIGEDCVPVRDCVYPI